MLRRCLMPRCSRIHGYSTIWLEFPVFRMESGEGQPLSLAKTAQGATPYTLRPRLVVADCRTSGSNIGGSARYGRQVASFPSLAHLAW